MLPLYTSWKYTILQYLKKLDCFLFCLFVFVLFLFCFLLLGGEGGTVGGKGLAGGIRILFFGLERNRLIAFKNMYGIAITYSSQKS